MTFNEFSSHVFKLTQVPLHYYKSDQMIRRINNIMTKHNCSTYEEYLFKLKTDSHIYNEFINHLTINVSEFYRNPIQWEILENQVLVPLLRNKKELKIWSSACSSGDEPYTMAMILSKHMPLDKIKILATDIDAEIIEKAKLGIYATRSVTNVPTEMLTKYFKQDGPYYCIDERIKNCVEFKKMDLLTADYPKDFDIIICRNVLIYFTNEAKYMVFDNFSKALGKEGVLFIGNTEQIPNPSSFDLQAIETFFYKKSSTR